MYCNQCGQQIDDDSRFCRHCGASQKREDGTARNVQSDVAESDPSSVQPTASPPEHEKPIALYVGIALAIVLVFFVIVSIPGGKTNSSDSNTQTIDVSTDNIEAIADNMTAIDSTSTHTTVPKPEATSEEDIWSYRTDEDKVRGGTTYFASTTSTNTIHQDPPYDSDTSMTMTVRKSAENGTDVLLSISSGQMMCPSYEGCSGTVRFDDGAAETVSLNGPSDDSSETVFVEDPKEFIAKLKKAKSVVIEKTLYDAGSPQFEFNVKGLKWDH